MHSWNLVYPNFTMIGLNFSWIHKCFSIIKINAFALKMQDLNAFTHSRPLKLTTISSIRSHSTIYMYSYKNKRKAVDIIFTVYDTFYWNLDNHKMSVFFLHILYLQLVIHIYKLGIDCAFLTML